MDGLNSKQLDLYSFAIEVYIEDVRCRLKTRVWMCCNCVWHARDVTSGQDMAH